MYLYFVNVKKILPNLRADIAKYNNMSCCFEKIHHNCDGWHNFVDLEFFNCKLIKLAPSYDNVLVRSAGLLHIADLATSTFAGGVHWHLPTTTLKVEYKYILVSGLSTSTLSWLGPSIVSKQQLILYLAISAVLNWVIFLFSIYKVLIKYS